MIPPVPPHAGGVMLDNAREAIALVLCRVKHDPIWTGTDFFS